MRDCPVPLPPPQGASASLSGGGGAGARPVSAAVTVEVEEVVEFVEEEAGSGSVWDRDELPGFYLEDLASRGQGSSRWNL